MASTADLSTCPFCNASYLQLGKHLPHCKKRNGRDYSHLLSVKTLQKRFQSKKKTECPKCHRLFKRLDTHFRVSATCKEINSNKSIVSSGLELSLQGQVRDEEAILSSPQNSNSAGSAPAASVASVALTTNTINTFQHNPLLKSTLTLPTTDEEWEQADLYFKTSLVPVVMAATSPGEMSTALCEGIYSYFASAYGTKATSTKKLKKRPLHSRALKEVERKKKEAKRELRSAKRSGSPVEVVQSLAHHFISLVRAHRQLKRASTSQVLSRDVKAARDRCHRNFKLCARQVLDGQGGGEVPTFGVGDATTFFSQVYHSDPRNFVQPEWMPTPPPPEVELDCSPFSESEVARVMMKMKSQSAPSPFDRVGYIIFKRCPSLLPALVQLFNICWAQSTIPAEWKCAASLSLRTLPQKTPPIQPIFDRLR